MVSMFLSAVKIISFILFVSVSVFFDVAIGKRIGLVRANGLTIEKTNTCAALLSVRYWPSTGYPLSISVSVMDIE